MTSLVKAIQERLAKICDEESARFADDKISTGIDYADKCARHIRAADLSDLEPKGAGHSGIYPRTAAASVVCACGVTVPQSVCNDLESELAALTARLEAKEAECARLRLPPEMTLSDHPGCAFCMEAGTPVRPGEVCPKCGDRLPTKREHELSAECEALRSALNKYGAHRIDCCSSSDHCDCGFDAAKDSHE